jgi:hypothetical protein
MSDFDPFLLRELQKACAADDAAAADFERFQLDKFGEQQAARSEAHRSHRETSAALDDHIHRIVKARIDAAVDMVVRLIGEETAHNRNADRKFLKQYVGEQFARWNFVATNPEMRRVSADVDDLMRQRK